jgi:hypothetical protein
VKKLVFSFVVVVCAVQMHIPSGCCAITSATSGTCSNRSISGNGSGNGRGSGGGSSYVKDYCLFIYASKYFGLTILKAPAAFPSAETRC